MDYKYNSEDFKACADAEEREDAPHRAVGMHQCGLGEQYPYQPLHQSGLLGKHSDGLGMPSFGKGPSYGKGLNSEGFEMSSSGKVKMKFKNFCNARPKPVELPQHIKEMPIKDVPSPYIKSQVIIIDTQGFEDEKLKTRVQTTFEKSYGILQGMAPEVTFQPNQRNLKCKGSITMDFCTASFEAAVWRVPSEDVYIYEFRRKSMTGRDAFQYLIRKMGSSLKDLGLAKVYGNGVEIFPPMEISMPDNLGDLAMPTFGGISSQSISNDNNDDSCPITLNDDDQMDRWCKVIDERQWPMNEETLRLFARCCCNSENTQIMAEHQDLQKALIKELQLGSVPDNQSNCQNVLTILFAILQSASPGQRVVEFEDEILLAAAKALMTFSGLKQKKKIIRSVALERAALKVLWLLSENPKQYNQKHISKVIQMLEGPQQLKDEVNQERLVYVIGNLKKANASGS